MTEDPGNPPPPDSAPRMVNRRSDRGRRVMALDVGSKRIGVALSDETGTIATPFTAVERGRGDHAAFRRLVAAWDVGRIVVGLPTGLSGREGPQTADVRAYAASLTTALASDATPPPTLDYWDERLTTAIAERSLIATGTRRADRRSRVDAVAAAVILQDYLDAKRRRRREGGKAGRREGG